MNLIEKKSNKIVFLVFGINATIANAIRRSVYEIPILAIDEVEFVKNDSALYDEIIAHRLGLLPMKNQDLFERESCSCKGKGCAKCTVALKLSAKGPKVVMASDIKGKAEFVYDMPIVILTEGQELQFNAFARLGKAREHTKFNPGLIFYYPLVSFETTKECDLCGECVKACPKKILFFEKKISIKNIESCDSCMACVEACKKKHGKECIKISQGNDFVFTIESFGQISPQEIFLAAIKALNENLSIIEKKLKKAEKT